MLSLFDTTFYVLHPFLLTTPPCPLLVYLSGLQLRRNQQSKRGDKHIRFLLTLTMSASYQPGAQPTSVASLSNHLCSAPALSRPLHIWLHRLELSIFFFRPLFHLAPWHRRRLSNYVISCLLYVTQKLQITKNNLVTPYIHYCAAAEEPDAGDGSSDHSRSDGFLGLGPVWWCYRTLIICTTPPRNNYCWGGLFQTG